MEETVQMTLPAKAEYLTTVRLVAGSLAGQAGFDMEEIEDIKTALSEACLLLIPCLQQPGVIKLQLCVRDGVSAKVSAHCSPESCPNTPERQFSVFLLQALCNEFEFSYTEGESEYRFYKALSD
ncbi:MAG TPA: ATP-binding protein [Feifaniaceae bacterium]|nr:ATP-binding protein [Feifaniaceae bacterium]